MAVKGQIVLGLAYVVATAACGEIVMKKPESVDGLRGPDLTRRASGNGRSVKDH